MIFFVIKGRIWKFGMIPKALYSISVCLGLSVFKVINS